MVIFLLIIIIAFAFFAQSLLGFGGGLICIPILSLFMPVQDVVSMVMVYQISMGLLIFKVHHHIRWQYLLKLLPSTVVGAVLGVVLLNYVEGDIMRGILAGYIILHLLRKHTSFDPMGFLIRWGGCASGGFSGRNFKCDDGWWWPRLYLVSER